MRLKTGNFPDYLCYPDIAITVPFYQKITRQKTIEFVLNMVTLMINFRLNPIDGEKNRVNK